MSVQLASAYMQIIPSMQGFQGAIAKEVGGGAATSAGSKFGSTFSGGFKSAIGPLAGIAVAGLGISKLTGFITDSVQAVGEWQALNAQSASAVKATGGAANVTATQVHNLATSIEGATSTQAESIQKGANLLLTFKGIRNEAGKGNDIFNQSTKTLVDMARAMGTEPQAAAIQLGKALNDPVKGITALTRVGVTFSDSQKKQIAAMQKSGNTMGAQKIILKELNSEFGGSGAAYRATFPGQLYQMRDAVGDFGEKIATAALPALTALVGTTANIFAWATNSGIIEKVATAIGTAFTAVKSAATGFFASLGGGSGVLTPVVGFLQAMGTAVAPLIPALLQAATAFSPLRIAFTALAPVLPVISLALAQVSGALGQSLLTAVAAVAPSIVAVTNGLVAFLVPLLKTPALVQTVAVGFLAWKVATAGFAFAGLVTGLVQTTVQLGLNAAAWVRNAAAQVVSKAQTVAIMAMYAGEFVANLVRSGVALGVQAAQWIASTTAMVAARVAMVAGAVATGIATAAQWALNAALSANPIGIIIVAIAALVAGLIWFFTQTKLGQQIWSGFITWLVGAWNTIVAVASTVWNTVVTAVSGAFNRIIGVIRTVVGNVLGFLRTWGPGILAVLVPVIGIPLLIASHWNQIVAVARTVWSLIVGAVTASINRVRAVITAVVSFVVGVWTRSWNLIVTVIRTVWNFIISIVTSVIGRVRSIISSVISTITGIWTRGWNTIRDFVGKAWAAISKAVSDGVNKAITFVKGLPGKALAALGKLGSTLFNSGKALIGGFIEGIKAMAKPITDAVGGVLSAARKLFPSSPAKEGPFSGRGWVLYSGHAIGEGLAEGMSDRTGLVRSAATGMMTAAHPALGNFATPGIATVNTAGLGVAGSGFPSRVTLVDSKDSILGHMDVRIDRYDMGQQLAGAR